MSDPRDLSVPLPQVPAEQFFSVDIRAARVLDVAELAKARHPAYQLTLDLGPLGQRISTAQITNYRADQLVGSTVVCVVNLPPRRVAGVKSEVLVLGVYDAADQVTLLRPAAEAVPGSVVG